MNAKEMFEKLGYTYYNQDEDIIVEKEYYKDNNYFRQYIIFNTLHKVIDISILDSFLTLEELKAINQMVTELKWE